LTVEAIEAVTDPAVHQKSLFERYRNTDDLRARRELIERHLPLARRLARRYGQSRDVDDLEQVAALGLIKAIDRYDPERGAFPSFAIPTIIGELKRYFRDACWALRMPRELQERAQAVERELDRQTVRLGRAPSARELADALDFSVEDVLEAQAALTGRDAASLDAPMPGGESDGGPRETAGSEEAGYELVERRSSVAPAVATLSERERAVLHLRFVEDLTQREIGLRLGISQMQVSRLLRRSLESVRVQAEG
jgi:RNA polymerase sigma-B factor